MTDRLTPQREAEIDVVLAAYAKHPEIGFDCCSAHGAADAAHELRAELAAVRTERDAARERLETVRSLCDAADYAGITLGGWFTVEAVRKAIKGATA